MSAGAVVAVASLSLALLVNGLAFAYNYGRLHQKVKELANHISTLAGKVDEVSERLARMEGLLNRRRLT